MGLEQPTAKHGIGEPYKAPRPDFIPIYKHRDDPASGLLCLFDYRRGVITIMSRGRHTVDLGAEIVAYFEKQKDVPV